MSIGGKGFHIRNISDFKRGVMWAFLHCEGKLLMIKMRSQVCQQHPALMAIDSQEMCVRYNIKSEAINFPYKGEVH